MTSELALLDEVGTSYPGIEPRLVGVASEGLESYLERGGYRPLADAATLLDEIGKAGLRGRGGAAFPTARKLQTLREAGASAYIVANGEEGEPTSAKDRWLLRNRPHLVLDGLRLAAAVVGTSDAAVYISDERAEASISRALAAATDAGLIAFHVRVHRVAPAYVAGEETAVVRALNGGPALPTDKPPRPFEEGVDLRPTLVSNVETLANLPAVQRLGAAAYRAVGTERSPGTFLLTLTGLTRAGLYEVPFGTSLREVLAWTGDDPAAVRGFLMGGYFAGVIGPQALDVPLDYDEIAAWGSGLGCGAVVALGDTRCPVDVTAAVMGYFDRENAGQCGSCFNGTAAMGAVLAALRDGQAEESDVERLRAWSVNLRGRGACGTLDGATNVAASLLRDFPDEVRTHLHGHCEVCAERERLHGAPFAVTIDEAVASPQGM
ncbi:NADH-ubiquinone oxidoreductase-F iron-sulfur binding region domain-containing protein [Microbacterium sp.]|uniref:NADH-ubiquinone oxidoreductase-F iron-sulfur binding region domain-containing protein n=1 Tax=Microbacterium sp. TaxID=51671 RepID=UPI0037C85C65